MMTPTLGQVVHYRLSDQDATAINALPAQHNPTTANQTVAAIVVQVWNASTCNLRLLLDGDSDYWATSRVVGNQPGQWNWPQHITT